MQLPRRDAEEIAGAVPLAVDLESYRERLTPLALAVLQGEPRRAIDRRRKLVLPDVWDGRLKVATLAGLSQLRAELERKIAMLELAEAELQQPRVRGLLPELIVERVLSELLVANDANLAALSELERELAELPVEDRPAHAVLAARGAYVAARIPPNELRAAITRAALCMPAGDAEAGAALVARGLATERRRQAVHEWVAQLAEGSRDHVPLLAAALEAIARSALSLDPVDDPIWVQACVGMTLELGIAQS